MNKTALITRHEFLNVVRRKGFVILTLAFPVIALLGILAGQVVPGLIPPSTKTEKIGYVDKIGIFTENKSGGALQLLSFTSEEEAKAALINKSVKEYFIIPPDYMTNGTIQIFTLTSELAPETSIQNAIRDFLLNNLLRGDTAQTIARVKNPLNIASTTLTGTGEVSPRQGGFGAIILPYIFSLLLIMAIFSSSGYLLQGLMEEKENRVMEIILSSISPRQLLAGKVFGLGAAGLLQIVVWLISANFIFRLASESFKNILGVISISPEFLILGVVYFILGYLLMAVAMAGVGALSSTAREGQQMSALFIIPVIIPIYFLTLIMSHPENVVVKILTFIPFTAPITVMARIGLSEIPIWELIVSIGLLVLTVWGFFILATKLFRTYLLMYGKRPQFNEIWRSLRQA